MHSKDPQAYNMYQINTPLEHPWVNANGSIKMMTILYYNVRNTNENKSTVCYQFFVSVVNQKYKVQVHDEYVMSGNTAVLKCQVSSFV